MASPEIHWIAIVAAIRVATTTMYEWWIPGETKESPKLGQPSLLRSPLTLRRVCCFSGPFSTGFMCVYFNTMLSCVCVYFSTKVLGMFIATHTGFFCVFISTQMLSDLVFIATQRRRTPKSFGFFFSFTFYITYFFLWLLLLHPSSFLGFLFTLFSVLSLHRCFISASTARHSELAWFCIGNLVQKKGRSGFQFLQRSFFVFCIRRFVCFEMNINITPMIGSTSVLLLTWRHQS